MSRRVFDADDRRGFIKSVCVFAVSCAVVPVSLACSDYQAEAQSQPSDIDVADSKEPGTRIHLSGTILDMNGKPVSGVKMFVYHTDATGYYSRPVNDPRQSRLRGTLWSNAAGQYSFHTIKPAPYGDVGAPPPMHIHVHLQPPDLSDHWVESFYFADDTRLRSEEVNRSRELGRFANIITLSSGDAGVLKGVRDFRIDPAIAQRNKI